MTDPDNRLEQQLRQALDQSTATLDQATCDELARRRADVLSTAQRSYRPQPWLIAAALATFAVLPWMLMKSGQPDGVTTTMTAEAGVVTDPDFLNNWEMLDAIGEEPHGS